MPRNRSTPRSGLRVALIGAPLLLVGYVLSIGPAARILMPGGLDNLKLFHSIYRPITYAAHWCYPLKRGMFWYVNLWLPSNIRYGHLPED